MGDLTDRQSQARFSLRGEALRGAPRWVVCYIRAVFAGGTGTGATMSLFVDSLDAGDVYDFRLDHWDSMGTDDVAYLNARIASDELYHWFFDPTDALVFTWTNPDADNMRWALELGLAPVPPDAR